MGKSFVDTILSAMVLVVAAMFTWFAYTSTNVRPVSGYDVTARFHTVAGLAGGNDVKIAGIKVGTVTAMDISPDTFDARITIALDLRIKLPKDSKARIASEGLLGGTYLAIDPGKESQVIPPGGEITETQSPEDIVQLIGKKIFGGAENTQ